MSPSRQGSRAPHPVVWRTLAFSATGAAALLKHACDRS